MSRSVLANAGQTRHSSQLPARQAVSLRGWLSGLQWPASLVLAAVMLLGGAVAQAAEQAPLRFDLPGADGQRVAWTSDGPATPSAGDAEVLGGGAGSRQRVNALALSTNGPEAYAQRGNGGTLVWLPQGLAGESQDVAPDAGLPQLSWVMALAWDEPRGVLMLVSSGQEGLLYRYDTRRHRWLNAHQLNYGSVSGLAFNAATGGFVAVTADAEVLVLDADGQLQQVHPLAGVLADVKTARKRSAGGVSLEGLAVVAQGTRLALVNVYAGRVSHIWTYDLDTRQASLSYRDPGLPAAASAASAAASAPAPSQRIATLARWLLHPVAAWTVASPFVQVGVMQAALAAAAVALALLVWQALRGECSVGARLGSGLLTVVLAAAPLPVFLAGVPDGREPWLAPLELFQALQMLQAAWRMQIPLSQVFGSEVLARAAVTACLAVVLLSVVMALLRPRWRPARLLLACTAVLLTVTPARSLWAARAEVQTFAREVEAGEALFNARCGTAGATRRYAVGAVEGLRLTKLRAAASEAAYTDRDWDDAGLPGDRVGEAYIRAFLDIDVNDTRSNSAWSVPGLPGVVTLKGYSFVDVVQPDEGYLRYRLDANDARRGMLSEPIAAHQAARYAVRHARLDTPDERRHWVAGAVVTVVDTQTGDAIGELKAFAYAPPLRQVHRGGPGSGDADVRDWRSARTCPEFNDLPDLRVRLFTEQVLQRPRR